MKKARILALLLVFAATAAAMSRIALAEDEAEYTFGIMLSSSKQDAQLKQIFSDVIDFVAQAQGVRMETRWYTHSDRFLAAAAKKELDFAYTKQYDSFYELVFKQHYIPISSISVFGRKQMKLCLYTPEEMNVKTFRDLEGKRLITYPRMDGYYPLRELLGEKPQDFFSSIEVTTGGNYALDRMLDGEADAVLAYDINVDFLGLTNPSVAKRIKDIFCSVELVNTGITHAEGVPDSILTELIDIMKHARRHEALKQYRPLMNATKISFFPVSEKHYNDVKVFYEKGAAEGWDREFENWYDELGRPEQ